MADSNEPREDLQAAQQWAEEEAFFAEVHRMTQAVHQEEAPSLAQVCYDAYAEALALPWAHAYGDLPPHLRTAWEAVAAAMEVYWHPQPLQDLKEDRDV